MIQQGLVKQVSVDSSTVKFLPEQSTLLDSELKQVYAKQIVVDYFVQNINLSIKNLLGNASCAVDLFTLSKGLIFSKAPDEELNDYLIYYFNLLSQVDPREDDKTLQQKLFARINQARR